VPSQISCASISKVVFKGEPKAFGDALDLIAEAQYADAVAAASAVKVAELGNSNTLLMQRDYLLNYAYGQSAMQGDGGTVISTATTGLSNFLGNRGRSHYAYYSCVKLLGDLYAMQSNLQGAKTCYGLYANSPTPIDKMRATLALADIACTEAAKTPANGRALYTTADGMYKKALQIAATIPGPEGMEAKTSAQLGIAFCLAALGNTQAAETAINTIIKSNSAENAAVQAKAYNALGRAHYNAQAWKKAKLDYLQTHLLFAAGGGDLHAEALYYLSLICSRLQQVEERTAYVQELEKRYSRSIWAQKARTGR